MNLSESLSSILQRSEISLQDNFHPYFLCTWSEKKFFPLNIDEPLSKELKYMMFVEYPEIAFINYDRDSIVAIGR